MVKMINSLDSKASVLSLDDNANNPFEMFRDPSKYGSHINLSKATMKECVEAYVNYKMSAGKKHIKRGYGTLINHLTTIERKYELVIMPNVVGVEFFRKMEYYFSEKCNLAGSTIECLITKMKTVLSWASKYGASVSMDYNEYKPEKNLAKPKLVLTIEDIYKLYYFDIDTIPHRRSFKRTLTKVRDQFLLSCFLGQRYSDMSRIESDNFFGLDKNTFKITQQKTGNQAVVDIKLFNSKTPSIVNAILKKYDYQAPYQHDICDYNRYLHILCKLAQLDDEVIYEYKSNGKVQKKVYKKYQLISSHCGRRTFVTNAVKEGIHSERIKQASGHKTDSAFGKYVVLGENG